MLPAAVLALPLLFPIPSPLPSSEAAYVSSSGTSKSNGSLSLLPLPAALSAVEGGRVGPGSPQLDGKLSERFEEVREEVEESEWVLMGLCVEETVVEVERIEFADRGPGAEV